ncbi:5'/3'-nucleotidase SurE [Candidatus Micrarchaeota archaeon]|nr:5'/3'-nucleotidase SurE [Candidatus Micrarchaeota archaeon]MBU1681759.1 5'/3'-nucleotidase SurE [Candidatus Micrarchaeota archaeon]
MIILVTNDDGDSEGLRSLVEAGTKFGDTYAIVPNRQRSAISRAITLHKPIRIHKITDKINSINGTPADCVLFSLNSGEFAKPDLILSGINWGDNTCLGPLIGSGTIGACWQAVLDGVPSIAFSVHKDGHDWHKKENWGTREELVQTVTRVIEELKPKLKDSSFFSVNLPEKHVDAEIVYTHKFQKRKYKTVIEKRKDPNGVPYFWIGGELEEVKEETDLHEVVVNNKITISEVSLSIFKSD